MSAYLRTREAFGPSVMRFSLVYDGELKPNGSPRHKWEIRQQLSPQLMELWNVSPALQHVRRRSWVPRAHGFGEVTLHHSVDLPTQDPSLLNPMGDWINVCEPIDVKGVKFLPLIRDSLALCCGLKILYLRKEKPGNLIYQGGDIDNRLKTLFDALSLPNEDQIVADPTAEQPIHTLLEDDRLISGCNIETQRLLSAPNAKESYVRLIIEAEIRVSLARPYNHAFLGD